MGFNMADYQPVEERNAQFWAKFPDGRILTDLVFDDGSRYVVRAEVYTDREDTRPAATGYAEENVTNSGVNKTSALENCETSAEGRALARLGFAPKGARPSREEMQKAQRGQQNGAPEVSKEAKEALEELAATCDTMGYDRGMVATVFAKENGGADIRKATTPEHAARIRKFIEHLDEVDPTRLKAPAAATNGAAS